ncbi:MAG: DUF2066 domain-containing protein [Rickettsiales bacterium]
MKILYILVILTFFQVPAWAGETIINSQVEVDATGEDAVDARAQAMAKGSVDALTDLLNKLSPLGQAQDIVAMLDSRKIDKMVKGIEVFDERISDNSYYAKLIVSFDGDELSALIAKSSEQLENSSISDINSFLIIPSYQEDRRVILWEDNNPWRAVWKNAGLENISGDIIVPYGDFKDSSLIDLESISTVTFASLVPMTIRYGVSDIVIVQAKLTETPDLALSVTKRRISRNDNEISVLNYRADPQETRDLLLARAARAIIYELQHKKNEELLAIQAVRGGEHNKMMMLASISTLSSWTQLREKLSALPMVDRVELLAISAKQVDMIVHYRGKPESLARAIQTNNIRLIKNKDYWVVSRD